MYGAHVSRAHAPAGKHPGLVEHIIAARSSAAAAGFDMRLAQVFVSGPRTLTQTLTSGEAAALKSYLADRGDFAVYAHGAYSAVPWRDDKPFFRKFIRDEVRLCESAGIAGLVIHLGRPGVETVVAALPHLVGGDPPGRRGCLIYLETPHIKAEHSLYETPEKLAGLFREIRTRVDPGLCRFGLCIDTAHLWSCGVDIRSRASAEAWLARLEAVSLVIPRDRILIHLNDNYAPRGGGGDRHAPLLGGEIWGEFRGRPEASGLSAFVDYADRWDIPVVLERAEADLASDYGVLWALTDNARL